VSLEFTDRLEAGQRLARVLEAYRHEDAVVLGMARGGVAVAFAFARDLDLPLEALVIRKLGAPYNPELAIGAVSETGQRWIDEGIVQATGASPAYIDRETQVQMVEAKRRQQAYGSQPARARGHVAVVVDDGVATGASAMVAIRSARDLGAASVTLATPAASPQAIAMLRFEADEVFALRQPDPFLAVGLYYVHFDQVSDDEVVEYLREARDRIESA
jgi:putative phosphoribosyl transferase